VCPRRTAPIRTGVALAETFRGPRGLREGVVQDLERLYRLVELIVLAGFVKLSGSPHVLSQCPWFE
jgi:hypothetical protein